MRDAFIEFYLSCKPKLLRASADALTIFSIFRQCTSVERRFEFDSFTRKEPERFEKYMRSLCRSEAAEEENGARHA